MSQYLGRLDSERAVKYESLLEVAVSLCAINRLIKDSIHKPGKRIPDPKSSLPESSTESNDPEVLKNEPSDDFRFPIGSEVEANYKGLNRWYPCLITEMDPSGLYEVEYKDGVREGSVPHKFLRPVSRLPIEGNTAVITIEPALRNDQLTDTSFLPIIEKFPDTKINVQIVDNEPHEEDLHNKPEILHPEKDIERFSVDDEVEANYKGRGFWQPAVIRQVRSNGLLDVDYIDGSREIRLPSDFIRIPTKTSPSINLTAAAEEVAPELDSISAINENVGEAFVSGEHQAEKIISEEVAGFDMVVQQFEPPISSDSNNNSDPPNFITPEFEFVIGTDIECNFENRGDWYPGRIAAINSDGSFNIDYDDGDKEVQVLKDRIRLWDRKSSQNNQNEVRNTSLPTFFPRIRSRSNSPNRDNHAWNPYFNMPPTRTLPSVSPIIRKGCTCRVPGYDCHRKGGCLFEALKLTPLDVASRPRFMVRHFCDCAGSCGCKGTEIEKEAPAVVEEPELLPPVQEAPSMISFAIQTDEPYETFDQEVQYEGPEMVETAIQYDNAFTDQKAMQTENPTESVEMQTENPQSENAIQFDGPVFMDQACQTIDFEKRLTKRLEKRIPFSKSPPFVVKAVCKEGCGCCCNSHPDGRKALSSTLHNKSTEVSMKNMWTKWAMEHHTFSNVLLSESEINQFSGAVKEFLVAPSDVISFGPASKIVHPSIIKGMLLSSVDEKSTVKNTLPSLKYFMTDKKSTRDAKSSGLIVKALTNDQRLQNKLFLRECRNLWKIADNILNIRIIQFVVNGVRSRIEFDANLFSLLGQLYKHEIKALYEFGLKKLRLMLEDDEDKKQKEETEKALEKLREGNSSHQQFVKKKDRFTT